jgi:hypothetical protein
MRSTGNTKSNQLYNPSNKPSPTISLGGDASESIALERYIRDKYERKSFMKAKKPLPPSPAFQRDTDRISAILGPPARSPSLGSSNSGNVKPQRASEESFERAKSPASTNSSVEAPPPKPLRPVGLSTGATTASNPFLQPSDPIWTSGPRSNQPLMNPSPSVSSSMEVVSFPPPPAPPVILQAQSTNPFQPSQTSLPQQSPPISPQPAPQISPFTSQNAPNPFLQSTGYSGTFQSPTLQRAETMPPQITSSLWDSVTPPTQPTFNPQPMQAPPISPLSRNLTFPPSLNGTGDSNNPFSMRSPYQSSESLTPSNPFTASLPPIQSPQTQSPFNSMQTSVPISPFNAMQSPIPQQPQQQIFQPVYPSQPQSYQQLPLQTFSPIQNNAGFASQRMDKQGILNLFNTPPSFPQQPLRTENYPNQWTQQ